MKPENRNNVVICSFIGNGIALIPWTQKQKINLKCLASWIIEIIWDLGDVKIALYAASSKIITSCNDDFSKLQLADIYKLKDAIKQDKASLEFVFRLCQKYEGAKKALDLLKDKGANL